jgi:hypothetical protein
MRVTGQAVATSRKDDHPFYDESKGNERESLPLQKSDSRSLAESAASPFDADTIDIPQLPKKRSRSTSSDEASEDDEVLSQASSGDFHSGSKPAEDRYFSTLDEFYEFSRYRFSDTGGLAEEESSLNITNYTMEVE